MLLAATGVVHHHTYSSVKAGIELTAFGCTLKPAAILAARGTSDIHRVMPAPTAALSCYYALLPIQCRGHTVYVVADTTSDAFAKMAAARHSSNTTAEAMPYIYT